MYEVKMERLLSQNRADQQLQGIEYLIERATGGNRGRWTATQVTPHAVESTDQGYLFGYTLVFEKTSGRRNNDDLILREWHRILAILKDVGENTRFGQYLWRITSATHAEGSPVIGGDGPVVDGVQVESQSGTRSAAAADYQSLEEVREAVGGTIDALLADDELVTNAFNEIYDRNAQIRTLLSSIKSFFDSDGKRRNHALLYGLPACAKTQILRAVTDDLLGEQAVLSLDATSTTSAGIYKVFFEQLDVIPPIVKIEEMEKTEEAALRVWLGALDERGELRKVNYREQRVREVRILCLGTCNDKEQFDRLMGGTVDKPGALSSRFVHQLKCPRPNREVLFKILHRDIAKYGGKQSWIWPAIHLAECIATDDPRKVLAFLDGGDRLLNGAYQHDILKIVEMGNKYDDLMELTLRSIDQQADLDRQMAARLREVVAA